MSTAAARRAPGRARPWDRMGCRGPDGRRQPFSARHRGPAGGCHPRGARVSRRATRGHWRLRRGRHLLCHLWLSDYGPVATRVLLERADRSSGLLCPSRQAASASLACRHRCHRRGRLDHPAFNRFSQRRWRRHCGGALRFELPLRAQRDRLLREGSATFTPAALLVFGRGGAVLSSSGRYSC